MIQFYSFSSHDHFTRWYIRQFILVMQRFWVIQHGISCVSCLTSRYTHERWHQCVYQEYTSDKCDISWYSTRARCITILYTRGTLIAQLKKKTLRLFREYTKKLLFAQKMNNSLLWNKTDWIKASLTQF